MNDPADLSSPDVALAATDRPLPIRVTAIPDDRIPDGMTCLGSYVGDRLIARCAVPEEAADSVEAQGVFRDPVRLVLAAKEENPGLQCRLFAVVEIERLESVVDDATDPWAASLPGAAYDHAVSSEEGGADRPTHALVFLGQIVRFDRDRKHRGSLPLETADVLRRIVHGQAVEVVDKVLEDLLGDSSAP